MKFYSDEVVVHELSAIAVTLPSSSFLSHALSTFPFLIILVSSCWTTICDKLSFVSYRLEKRLLYFIT